jgi:aubergine-like protein
MFLKKGNKIYNPEPGTVIDTELVETEGEERFDFFLQANEVNQGCARPVHFFVEKNGAKIPKDVIYKFSYDMCHAYFNWTSSIKVPAPTMYAHKIAFQAHVLGIDVVNNESMEMSLHFL